MTVTYRSIEKNRKLKERKKKGKGTEGVFEAGAGFPQEKPRPARAFNPWTQIPAGNGTRQINPLSRYLIRPFFPRPRPAIRIYPPVRRLPCPTLPSVRWFTVYGGKFNDALVDLSQSLSLDPPLPLSSVSRRDFDRGKRKKGLHDTSSREKRLSTIFVSLPDESKRRESKRERLFLTRVLRMHSFSGNGVRISRGERKRGRVGTCPAWTISRGKSGKTSGTGTSRHGGVASPEKSYRICMPKEVVWLHIYIYIYIYIYMRTCPQSEEKGWFLSFSSSCSQNHDSKSRPSLLRRSRIKLPRTRTGINFALERARVEIPNHWRELRSGSVFGNGAVDRRGGAIIPPWTSPVSVFIKLETLCPPRLESRFCAGSTRSILRVGQ